MAIIGVDRSITSASVARSRRRLSSARTKAPSAPTADASVTVAHPAKIDPRTRAISRTGGTKLRSIRSGRLPASASAPSGIGGARRGAAMPTSVA